MGRGAGTGIVSDLPLPYLDLWVEYGSSLNMLLRGEPEIAAEMDLPDDPETVIALLDEAMRGCDSQQQVWKGVSSWRLTLGLPYSAVPQDALGREFIEQGFTSVTADRKLATLFSDGRVLLRLEIPEGTPLIDLQQLNSQQELLLGRDLRFHVSAVSEADDGYTILDATVLL